MAVFLNTPQGELPDIEEDALDGNEIWEILFGIMRGNVPDEMTEEVCEQLAAALNGIERLASHSTPAAVLSIPNVAERCENCGCTDRSHAMKPGPARDMSITCALCSSPRGCCEHTPAGEDVERGLEAFTAYFVRNYPGPNTIIHNPHWHAPRIYRAAVASLPSSTHDELVEALTEIEHAESVQIARHIAKKALTKMGEKL